MAALERGVEQAGPTGDWLVGVGRAGLPLLRLFCLSYAGRGASVYRLWRDALPAGVELCRVQLPGREDRLREALFTRMGPLVEALVGAMRPYIALPFALFGHSVGALVAFELARSCRRMGRPPAHLLVSGRRAPHLPDGSPLSGLPEPELVEGLRRRYGTGIPEAVLRERELMDLLVPVLRADLALCETHELAPEAPLDCPITAFGGLDDGWVTAEHLSEWRQHTSGRFEVHRLAGDHFFVETARVELTALVSTALAPLLNGPPGPELIGTD